MGNCSGSYTCMQISGSFQNTSPAELAKPDQSLLLLVPKAEEHRLEAAPEGESMDIPKVRRGFECALQTVIRDGYLKMMNVVKADVAREPLQETRQFQVAAAMEGSLIVAPV